MSEFQANFQDSETAFADKTDQELVQKYRIFKMMNSNFLVNLGTKLTIFAFKYNLPIENLIKRTMFPLFCGGESVDECTATIEKLGKSNIGAILDFSVEGKTEEADFERTKDEILRNVDRAKNDTNIPFAVFKVTGIAPLGTLEKVSSGASLTEKGEWKWENIQRRVRELCERARSVSQPIFIDAEETWIQPAIDDLAEKMMSEFNKEKSIVMNTVQLYRTDRLQYLKDSFKRSQDGGYKYGVKLVRGAYMEKERDRAEEKGYPSPIHNTKEETDRDYNLAVSFCLDNIDDILCMAATHNDRSTENAIRIMHEKSIPNNHPNIHFSQLYGMSDNISYVLAKDGYNVTKYVPYGPVKDAIPYLMRRARENTAVMGQMSREYDLVAAEIKRRKLDD